MFIRSQNLFLRPVWAEDWAAILAGVRDEAVARNLPAVPWPYGEVQARQFASQPQDQHYPHFLITCPAGRGASTIGEAEAVGCIGLTPEAGPDGSLLPALGFWIARAHWGRGFATEAGRALLGLAPVLGHAQLLARCFRDNAASARVLRKLGFAPTGEMAQRTAPARGEPAPVATFAIALKRVDDGAHDGNGQADLRGMTDDRAALRAA